MSNFSDKPRHAAGFHVFIFCINVFIKAAQGFAPRRTLGASPRYNGTSRRKIRGERRLSGKGPFPDGN
jgi:hypothetical protein